MFSKKTKENEGQAIDAGPTLHGNWFGGLWLRSSGLGLVRTAIVAVYAVLFEDLFKQRKFL